VEEQGSKVEDVFGDEDYKEDLYRGILWMKDKYEQYREMADQRYDRLKDQLAKVERRYEELLASLEGSRPVVGAKFAEPATQLEPTTLAEPATKPEPTAQPETETAEPITLVDPVGMESVVSAQSGPLGEEVGPESRVWNAEPRTQMADIPVAEREERSYAQELEEQSARIRQRLEEELGRVRHQLEEEVARSRRQQDEQAAAMETNRHLEQQLVYSNRQLEEKQRIISDLEGQLRSDKQKIDELVTKLRNNSQLLMKIYQELDKSLHFNDIPKEG
jgi:predicted RNase H-like nuclease (RuvC/YqgF family)